MKLRHLLFGLLAGVAFVACTNDDDPAGVTPVKGGDEVAAASYMKVNFVMPGNAVTRADEEGDAFEYGEPEENAVTSGVLFFFDGTAQVADPFELPANLGWGGKTTASIEKVSDVIVVLENPLRVPTSVVAVLNANLSDLKLDKTSTLDDIKAVVANFAAEGMTESGKFVMSSSAYNGAVNDVAAAIPENKIFDNKADAEKAANAVEIPVERVVAKVEVKEKVKDDGTSDVTINLANTDEPSNTVVIDGKEVQLKAKITGWWFDNAASQSLLLKNIDGFAKTAPFDGWNDVPNKRSYWANPNPGTLKHGTFGDAKNKAQYVQENVASTDEATKPNNYNATQVVVAAQIVNDQDKAVPLVKYSSELYTEDGFKTVAANVLAHKYWVLVDNTYKVVSASDFAMEYKKVAPEGTTALKPYEAYLEIKLKEGKTYYVKNGEDEQGNTKYKEATPTAAELKGYVVQRWQDGSAYYFVPIEHIAANGNNPAVIGVIRNHVYKLTINSITGLGTPVPFTDVDEIIPTIPTDTKTYISAKIEILAWKIVEQGVELGK